MTLTYFKFLFVTTAKRKSIWITWLLYLIVTACFIIVIPLATGLNTFQLWTNTSMMICQSFLAVAVSIFTSVLAINIFKNSNDEGTELIVVSKPIARHQIVWAKFLIFFIYCLIANLTAVLVSVFSIFVPTTEKAFYWGLVVSMFIGNLVTFGIFGAISVLLTVSLAKVGVIVCNVIISIVLFCYQIMAVFVFSNTMANLTKLENTTTTYQSYILPVRNTENGTYTEKNFVGFVSTPNKDGVFDIKATDWTGVRDFWDKKNTKNTTAMVASDIASQLATTYLSVNLHKYSDRFASRTYNFSNYYSYNLTGPVSEEFYLENNNNSPFKMVYSNYGSWGTFGSYRLYLPSTYVFAGLRSTKAPFLKGTVTHQIPIADIKGTNFLDTKDVLFEPEEWVKYKPVFDIMYDNIFKYDIKNGSGENYYQCTDLASWSRNFQLNEIWCDYGEKNIKRYYDLVWACLSGHHGDDKYFGSENDPLAGHTKESLDIKTPLDLNKRFIQFKNYCFFKVHDEQRDLMLNGISDEQFAKEATLYTNLKGTLETILNAQDLTQVSDDGSIGAHGFTIRAPKDKKSKILEPGTQTLNFTLLRYLRDAIISDFNTRGVSPTADEYIKEATDGSYAKWIKTRSILNSCVNPDESYMFSSLDTPERSGDISCEFYTTSKDWYPYMANLAAAQLGTYLPFGQNLELIYFEAKSRVQYWYFAVIWGSIALAAYGAGVIVYNKYDVK